MNATTKTALLLALALASATTEARQPRPLYPEPVYAMPKPPVYVWACKLGIVPACRRVREP